MSVDKAAIERGLREAWEDIRALVDSLSERELTEAGVVEEWSVKDLMGHMAFWAEKGANDLRLLATGGSEEIETPGSEEAVADWNARESASRKGKTLEAVRSEWLKSFDDALAALLAADADLLETEVKGWPQLKRFLADTTEHYGEHAEQIRAWQRQLETTEA